MPATERDAPLLVNSDSEQPPVDELVAAVYDELRRIAQRQLRRERPNHSLQTTELVNEAYLRLVHQDAPWKNQAHFLGVAAQMMRRILVDHARSHLYAKRGGGAQKVSLTEADGLVQDAGDLVKLNDALETLAEVDSQQVRIVELKFFAGRTIDEIAKILQISTATVEREWRAVRAWLTAELSS